MAVPRAAAAHWLLQKLRLLHWLPTGAVPQAAATAAAAPKAVAAAAVPQVAATAAAAPKVVAAAVPKAAAEVGVVPKAVAQVEAVPKAGAAAAVPKAAVRKAGVAAVPKAAAAAVPEAAANSLEDKWDRLPVELLQTAGEQVLRHR